MKYEILEYGEGISLKLLHINYTNLQELNTQIEEANKRIQNTLRINSNTLTISQGKLVAKGIAGVIHLNKNIEIEIIPKFLNKSDIEWKPTLYFLSILSKYGAISFKKNIHSGMSYLSSLYEIAGQILAENYIKNKRIPIRTYQRTYFRDYTIEGDIDFESIFERDNSGFRQSKSKFSKNNIYNATIKKAINFILPHIVDNQTRNILKDAIQYYGPQNNYPLVKMPIPVRNCQWEFLYNFAFDICKGAINSYEYGEILIPSFVVNTWRLWEWLLTLGMQIGSNCKVISQRSILFGKKFYKNKSYLVSVFPDIVVYNNENDAVPLMLIDAKYKTLQEKRGINIQRNDLYEAYAFCSASGCNELFLAYPDEQNILIESGNVREISRYLLQNIIIHVIKVNFGLIQTPGGIYTFGKNMYRGIQELQTIKKNF